MPSLYVGLGPIPFPSDLHYIIGEPIRFSHGPEAADDPEIVAALHRQVTDTTQALIDAGLQARDGATPPSPVEESEPVLDESSEQRCRVV